MNDFMIDGLLKLHSNRISGVPIVDSHGVLVGSLSASDLKRVHLTPPEELIYDLYQGVKTFFNIPFNEQEKRFLAKLPHFEPITVLPTQTLLDAMKVVNERKIHRVFEVDENKKLLSVCSLSDIVKNFL